MADDSNVTETDVTDAIPTMDNDTRTVVKKFAAYGILAAGSLLLLDDAVKSFTRRKKVKVVVIDKPSDPTTETPNN
jgi:hypothetical protein